MKKWSEVIRSPEYQSLPVEEKHNAQVSYFREVVAPQVPKGEHMNAFRAFLSENPVAKRDPTQDMSGSDKFFAGAGKAFTDIGRGVGQLFGGVSSDEVEESRRLDAPLMSTGAGVAGNIVGNVAAAAPTAIIPGANTYTGASLIGAGLGALQPTSEDESRMFNSAVGGVTGAAGQAVGKTIGRAFKPVQSSLNPEEARLAQVAAHEGIPLDAAQSTGSKPLKIVDSVLDNLPFTASKQASQRQTQQQAFNRAVLSKAGENADLATPDVIASARHRLGGEFQRISGGKSVALGDDLVNRLAEVDSAAAEVRGMLPTENIDRLVSGALNLAAKGKIKGETAQIIRSELTKEAKAAAAAGNNRLKDALKSVRDAIDDSIRNGLSPEERQAWDVARSQYGNLKTIEKTMQGASAGSAGGNISGAGLWTAVKQSNPNNFVKGAGDLNDLARVGQSFIKPQIPDSGTAQRLLAQQLMTGGVGAAAGYAGGGDTGSAIGGAAALLGGPKAIQMLLKSKAGQAYLKSNAISPEKLALINALARTGAVASVPSVNSGQ